MKKCIAIISSAAFYTSILFGCGSKTVTGGLVLTATTTSDYAELAYNVEELTEKSDFIAKVQVQETSGYVYPDSDMIYTQITPEVLEIYKGDYNEEKLELRGGYMTYADYHSAPIFQEEDVTSFDTSKYTEKELETAMIYYNVADNYIPQTGDTLLYFGVRSDNGNYQTTYDYQGLFCLKDGAWTNQALTVDGDWQEPLATDLLTLSGAAAVDAGQQAVTQTIDGITYTYSKSNHETMVAVPNKALIAAIQGSVSAE